MAEDDLGDSDALMLVGGVGAAVEGAIGGYDMMSSEEFPSPETRQQLLYRLLHARKEDSQSRFSSEEI